MNRKSKTKLYGELQLSFLKHNRKSTSSFLLGIPAFFSGWTSKKCLLILLERVKWSGMNRIWIRSASRHSCQVQMIRVSRRDASVCGRILALHRFRQWQIFEIFDQQCVSCVLCSLTKFTYRVLTVLLKGPVASCWIRGFPQPQPRVPPQEHEPSEVLQTLQKPIQNQSRVLKRYKNNGFSNPGLPNVTKTMVSAT